VGQKDEYNDDNNRPNSIVTYNKKEDTRGRGLTGYQRMTRQGTRVE